MNKVFVGNRVVTPSKIVCVGRNYYAHIEELENEVPDQMVLFSKPNSSVSNQLSSHQDEQLHYEGELCFLFEGGRFSAVGFGLDITKRKLQSILKEKGLPWERAKAFDGSAVFSKFVEISEVTTEMSFELKKNGNTVQTGHMELMMHEPQEILSEILTFMSLIDGDIVMTGTPKGVGKIDKGDVFSAIVRNNEKIVIEETWIAT